MEAPVDISISAGSAIDYTLLSAWTIQKCSNWLLGSDAIEQHGLFRLRHGVERVKPPKEPTGWLIEHLQSPITALCDVWHPNCIICPAPSARLHRSTKDRMVKEGCHALTAGYGLDWL